MLRRQRLKLLRFTVAAIAVLAVGAALLPAATTLSAHAAETRAAGKAAPPTYAQLLAQARRAAGRAASARKHADAAEAAAASAAANLRLAENNLNAVARHTGTTHLQPVLPAQMSDSNVIAAQNQLRQAQMAEQQEQLRAATTALNPPAGPGNSTAVFSAMNQNALQSAQSAVMTAQQNLAAAQQTQTMQAQAESFSNQAGDTSLLQAQQTVETARRLAASTAKAAHAAEINAQTLAEDADHARAAAEAAAPGPAETGQ